MKSIHETETPITPSVSINPKELQCVNTHRNQYTQSLDQGTNTYCTNISSWQPHAL